MKTSKYIINLVVITVLSFLNVTVSYAMSVWQCRVSLGLDYDISWTELKNNRPLATVLANKIKHRILNEPVTNLELVHAIDILTLLEIRNDEMDNIIRTALDRAFERSTNNSFSRLVRYLDSFQNKIELPEIQERPSKYVDRILQPLSELRSKKRAYMSSVREYHPLARDVESAIDILTPLTFQFSHFELASKLAATSMMLEHSGDPRVYAERLNNPWLLLHIALHNIAEIRGNSGGDIFDNAASDLFLREAILTLQFINNHLQEYRDDKGDVQLISEKISKYLQEEEWVNKRNLMEINRQRKAIEVRARVTMNMTDNLSEIFTGALINRPILTQETQEERWKDAKIQRLENVNALGKALKGHQINPVIPHFLNPLFDRLKVANDSVYDEVN